MLLQGKKLKYGVNIYQIIIYIMLYKVIEFTKIMKERTKNYEKNEKIDSPVVCLGAITYSLQ